MQKHCQFEALIRKRRFRRVVLITPTLDLARVDHVEMRRVKTSTRHSTDAEKVFLEAVPQLETRCIVVSGASSDLTMYQGVGPKGCAHLSQRRRVRVGNQHRSSGNRSGHTQPVYDRLHIVNDDEEIQDADISNLEMNT